LPHRINLLKFHCFDFRKKIRAKNDKKHPWMRTGKEMTDSRKSVGISLGKGKKNPGEGGGQSGKEKMQP
jgi:hypothetical protein